MSLTASIVASVAIILNVTKNITRYLPVGEFKFLIVYLQFFVLVLSVVIVLFYCIRYIYNELNIYEIITGRQCDFEHKSDVIFTRFREVVAGCCMVVVILMVITALIILNNFVTLKCFAIVLTVVIIVGVISKKFKEYIKKKISDLININKRLVMRAIALFLGSLAMIWIAFITGIIGIDLNVIFRSDGIVEVEVSSLNEIEVMYGVIDTNNIILFEIESKKDETLVSFINSKIISRESDIEEEVFLNLEESASFYKIKMDLKELGIQEHGKYKLIIVIKSGTQKYEISNDYVYNGEYSFARDEFS